MESKIRKTSVFNAPLENVSAIYSFEGVLMIVIEQHDKLVFRIGKLRR